MALWFKQATGISHGTNPQVDNNKTERYSEKESKQATHTNSNLVEMGAPSKGRKALVYSACHNLSKTMSPRAV